VGNSFYSERGLCYFEVPRPGKHREINYVVQEPVKRYQTFLLAEYESQLYQETQNRVLIIKIWV
jgi:hypothetical protein